MRSSSSSSSDPVGNAARRGTPRPRRRCRTRAPTSFAVAPQQMLVERGVVLLGRRHHVGLVLQRALAEGEPDRREVLLLAPQPHVPPTLARLAAVHRDDDGVLGRAGVEATRRPEPRARRAPHRSPDDRTSRALDECADREVGVEPAQPGGRRRPRVPTARRAAAATPMSAAEHVVRQQLVGVRRRTPSGSRPSTRKPVRPCVDERAQAADRRRPRPACRRRQPRAPRARTTRSGSARGTRRRRGSRSTAGGGAAAATKRTRSASSELGDAGRRDFAELCVTVEAARHRRRRRARRRDARERGQRPHGDVEPFERLDAADEQQHRWSPRPRAVRGRRVGRPARRRRGSTPGRHDLDAARASAP